MDSTSFWGFSYPNLLIVFLNLLFFRNLYHTLSQVLGLSLSLLFFYFVFVGNLTRLMHTLAICVTIHI